MAQKVTSNYFPDIVAVQHVFQQINLQLGQCVLILVAMIRPQYNRVLLDEHGILQISAYKDKVLQVAAVQKKLLIADGHFHLFVNDAVLSGQDDVKELFCQGLLALDSVLGTTPILFIIYRAI